MALLSNNKPDKTAEEEGRGSALPIKRVWHYDCSNKRAIPSGVYSSFGQCKACRAVLGFQCYKMYRTCENIGPKLTPFAASNNCIEPPPCPQTRTPFHRYHEHV